MSMTVAEGFARMLAARQRLVELRGERIETVLRLRTFLRNRLGEFLTTVDPIGGVRLAELGAEGSKAHGDLSILLTFFDGTRLRAGVDAAGRFGADSVPAHLFPAGEIVDIRVAADAGRAEIEFAAAPGGARNTMDVSRLLETFVAHAVAAAETEVAHAPQREVTLAPASRSGLSLRVR